MEISMQKKMQVVQTLLDTLPFIKKFAGQTIVIKFGGAAQKSPELKDKFALDIVLMHLVGIRPVVVHGGGPKITELLSDLGIDTEFVDGQRVTTKEAMRVVEMVLSGEVNKEIVPVIAPIAASKDPGEPGFNINAEAN